MTLTENEKKKILSKAAEVYGFDVQLAEEVPGHEGGRNLVYRIATYLTPLSYCY